MPIRLLTISHCARPLVACWVQVGIEKEKVNAENAAAQVEADSCTAIAREVAELQTRCEAELAAAEPLVAQAQEALNTLSKKDLGEQGRRAHEQPAIGLRDQRAISCMAMCVALSGTCCSLPNSGACHHPHFQLLLPAVAGQLSS